MFAKNIRPSRRTDAKTMGTWRVASFFVGLLSNIGNRGSNMRNNGKSSNRNIGKYRSMLQRSIRLLGILSKAMPRKPLRFKWPIRRGS